MERVRIPEDNRRDFYLYVDEFQNFVTDAFAGILSEARKYRLNLTVAHQYTAQLISDKSSAVRDAVFGNVGTMIVFRVGADDADFLEKEFEPEFTPQDIVNLPNYKVYLKLMIDGVTSRPFSAKTLPQMVKGGNKEVEEEVIRSSRALYCRSRLDVETEINNWSGMSLGEEGGPAPIIEGGMSKYPIVCSLCKQEKTVPFKPEPGRPAYCKECIEKIKSGEVKVERGPTNQISFDDTTFFRPLAELGIEFPDKSSTVQKRAEASVDGGRAIFKKGFKDKPQKIERERGRENVALKEIISKTLSQKDEQKEKPAPPPISLETLKQKTKEIVNPSKDRAARPEEMNKLKELILEKTMVPEPIPPPPPPSMPPSPPEPTPASPPMPPKISTEFTEETPPEEIPIPKKPKEIPEDVLRKVLE